MISSLLPNWQCSSDSGWARTEIVEKQYGQSFVGGLAGAGALLRRFTCRDQHENCKRHDQNVNTVFRNMP